jgi:AraC family transcriptional regulator, regulatory protein of adaptative response / methylated-DNA-[protein]-cysteine methyltransferase
MDRRKNRVGGGDGSCESGRMNDYERVARVIRYLDASHTDQPDLATLARHAGLTRFHFHRLFSAWAGITPKDFLQCLTLTHARELLRCGESVLEAALETGLSGPGRLHELCVTLDAATPGELKNGGEGWSIAAGFAETPFGNCLIGESPRGICHLAFLDPGTEASAMAELGEAWPRAKVRRDDRMARRYAESIFARNTVAESKPSLRVFVKGTSFQVRVWRALVHLPQGMVTSYGRLAGSLGMPRAARAVGTAVAQNAIAYLIPCHRVIRETGVVGDYRWGHPRKRAMLAWESAITHSERVEVSGSAALVANQQAAF